MNQIDYEKPNGLSRQDLVIFKLSLVGCGLLMSIGLLVYAVARFQSVVKASPDGTVNPGKAAKEQNILTQPSEQSIAIVKKPEKPENLIIVEEGSEAYHCIKNNGGSNCLTRGRFAPNYRVIAPPKPQKTYEDYLVQYGIRPGADCGRYLNGRPNC